MADKKAEFAMMLKELEFEQFIEICRIFEVDILDRKNFKEVIATEENDTAAEGNILKCRRDFDVMMEEIVVKYNKESRNNRRIIYKLMNKIVKANRAARRIISEEVTERYNAGVAQLDKIIAEQGDNDGTIA